MFGKGDEKGQPDTARLVRRRLSLPLSFFPLAIAALLAVFLGITAVWLRGGVSAYDRARYGRVERLSMRETESSAYAVLGVRLDNRLVSVAAPRDAGCRVGDRVQLIPAPGLIAKHFAFGPDGCSGAP
jgi:hypothetical protein